MEIVFIRNEGEEKRRVFKIQRCADTVEDLRIGIQRELNLDPSEDFCLGFLHQNHESLRDLGLNEGAAFTLIERTVPVSLTFDGINEDAPAVVNGGLNENLGKEDVALGDITGFEDLFGNLGKEDGALGDFIGSGDLFGSAGVNQEAAFSGFAEIGDLCWNTSQGSSQIQSQAPSYGPFEDPFWVISQGTNKVPSQVPAQHDNDAVRTPFPAHTTRFENIDEVVTENIKWFKPDHMITRVDYEREDINKKIFDSKIKVRVLFGSTVDDKWVVGVCLYVNGCDTLEDLRTQLGMERRLPLPPAFTFWNLSHLRLDENLSLIENGIGDGDVILICPQLNWLLKVFPPIENVEILVTFNPLCNVAELKKTLREEYKTYFSAYEEFTLTSNDFYLDDSKSLVSQMEEGQCVHVIV